MASYPPPSQNIDFFNPAFFTQDETALTLGEANKIYFKKSGGIVTGAVSMPSLTLNGTNVETKLLQIDINSNKLIDISYNNNVTYILHDLSVNGILKLPNLTNAGTTILDNKQKTTKISYDEGTSITTIGDTLKVPSTLIVGSNNYNVNDQFYKLTGISRGVTPSLTITDAVQINGVLNLPNNSNVDVILTNMDTILVHMEYIQETDKLIINSNVNFEQDMVIDGSLNVTGKFQLNSISDVEQKIIDVSNAVIPYISYDSVNDKLVVEKDMDLNLNDLNCNFMRKDGVRYRLSQDHNNTYLEFRTGGHVLDCFNSSNGTGRKMYLNYHANEGVSIGGKNNLTTTDILGNLTCNRDFQLDGSFNLGTITDVEQKIYDISNTLTNISYNTGTTQIDGSLNLGTIIDVEQKIIDISNNSSGGSGTPYISYDSVNDKLVVEKNMDLTINELTCNFMRKQGVRYRLSQDHNSSYLEFRFGGHTMDSFYPDGTGRTMFLNTLSDGDIILGKDGNNSTTYIKGILNCTRIDLDGSFNIGNILTADAVVDINGKLNVFEGNLYIFESTGTPASATGGTITLEHNDLRGESSIVFKHKSSSVDYGYIAYKDHVGGGLGIQRSLLEIGVQSNDATYPDYIDNIALMPSGYVGINTQTPQTMLDVSGDICCNDLNVNGKLNIFESIGSFPSSSGGSLTLVHGPTPSNRASSIVFKSSLNTNDFGYIAYYDDYNNQPAGRSLLEIGVQSNDETSDNIDNIILSPSGYVGINTVTPHTMLDVNGNIDCDEIQVNSIPINSFTNFRFGIVQGVQLGWGNGKHLSANISTGWYSHNKQFDIDTNNNFTCDFAYYGTYEITCNVIFRNSAGLRLNPCIGIAINDDIDISINNATGPNWNLRPQYQTPFSVQYVRNSEGRVCNLSCKRIHHFTNSTQKVSINTYVERTTGDDFNESVNTSEYELLDASIKFKYLGNFDNITSS